LECCEIILIGSRCNIYNGEIGEHWWGD